MFLPLHHFSAAHVYTDSIHSIIVISNPIHSTSTHICRHMSDRIVLIPVCTQYTSNLIRNLISLVSRIQANAQENPCKIVSFNTFSLAMHQKALFLALCFLLESFPADTTIFFFISRSSEVHALASFAHPPPLCQYAYTVF